VHVVAGSSTGWVNAAYLQEIGRPGYAGPVPNMTLRAVQEEHAPTPESSAPALYQSALPKCDDVDIIMKVVKPGNRVFKCLGIRAGTLRIGPNEPRGSEN